MAQRPTAPTYCQVVLEKGKLSDIRAKCRHHKKWILQQDGAPAHTAHNTIDYLKKENVDFINPDMWPPNRADLNPVDYAVWGCTSVYVSLIIASMSGVVVLTVS